MKKKVSPFEYEIDKHIHQMQVENRIASTVDLSAIEPKTAAEVNREREKNIREQVSRIRIKGEPAPDVVEELTQTTTTVK